MRASIANRLAAVAMAAVLAWGLAPASSGLVSNAFADSASTPKIDGNLKEWSKVPKQKSSDSEVSYWQIAKDASGNVYLAIEGTASTQWVSWDWSKSIGSTIDGAHATTALTGISQGWGALKGTCVQVNDANGNSEGPMYVEMKIDASSFKGDSSYSIDFAGSTVKAGDIPSFESSGSEEPATYKGIKIDGDYSDWAAVPKKETSDPDPATKNNLAQEAMVFDGDYVYLYIEEGKGGDAAGAGTHGNGRFVITTDLGNNLMVRLHHEGKESWATAGGQEVKCEHVGRQWEIAVPKSMVPNYEKTLSFGLYLEEPVIKDVANLDTSDPGNAGSFGGIVYDGDYSDWKDYPHTLIEYATAGTQTDVEDAQGALYSSDGMLYTHVKTVMKAHSAGERGSEFLQTVTYDLGDGRMYYPNFAQVGSDGTIHWYAGGTTLSPGTHELYLFSTDGYNNSTNINNLTSGDHVYGKVLVTVSEDGSVDEMESQIDLRALADKFNCGADDFKTIKAQFGRLGQQWISCAGTPTGAWLGTGIAIASVVVVVGGYALYRRRRQGVSR